MTPSRSSKKNSTSKGKVITFYSYKGGSARSLTVANTAWVLASNGKRVLVIDWDLEAPGLHRYFHPFIEDPELISSPGLIDFLIEMVEGSRLSHDSQQTTGWFHKYTNILRYAFSLEWKFPGKGTIDFVPAGQQNAAYGVRVMTFDWQGFYERLRGGIFLEAVKERLRSEYDYILIDSRTGISDASGICTVQMPDSLVVCFTLNNQSILGASAVADSAFSQRRKPSGEPGLKIWPVPTRVELAEKERLEMARNVAHFAFQKFLGHMPRKQREQYWRSIEIPYDPYFAYEEVLAPFAEAHRTKLSVLESVFSLTQYLTDREIKKFPVIDETLRRSTLALFSRSSQLTHWDDDSLKRNYCYLIFPNEDQILAEDFGKALQREVPDVTINSDSTAGDSDLFDKSYSHSLKKAIGIIMLVTPAWNKELPQSFVSVVHSALETDVPIILAIPIDDSSKAASNKLFNSLIRERRVIPCYFSTDTGGKGYESLILSLRDLLLQNPSTIEPEDPQRGQWGGKASQNGRTLSARVKEVTLDWFEIKLEVKKKSGTQLKGEVEFHLHPTFIPAVRRVPVEDGRAQLVLHAWGAFTVGASADKGKTLLELNLAKVPGAPQIFKSR